MLLTFFKRFIIFFNYVYVCVYLTVGMCTHISAGAEEARGIGARVVSRRMWALGTELWFSATTVCALNP